MASEQPAGYVCDGCGRLARDPEQDMQKLREDNFLSCCPERKMLPVYTRPAPAATDTGLKTIGFVPPMFVEGKGADYNDIFRSVSIAENYTAVVTRSQAEELLAAERAEKERLAALLHENGTPRFNAVCERAEKAEADNAAKEVRIKELEKERDHWKEYSSGQGKLIESGVFVTNDEYVRLTALEAKLAAAEKLLQGTVAAWESLPGGRNYSTGEVQDWILGPMQKAINRIRAVLGGKPS